jgi:hypothetical protein
MTLKMKIGCEKICSSNRNSRSNPTISYRYHQLKKMQAKRRVKK